MSPSRRFIVCTALILLSSAAGAATERTVSVNGTGIISVAPDIAHLQLAVVERSASLTFAQQSAATVTTRALDLLDKLGVDRSLVNTTGTSVRPEYRWNREKEEQEMVGYIAERNIEVELRDLDKLGEVIEGAVKAGVNQVQPPVLDSSKRRSAYREALAAAASDARANAAMLASAMGAKLGEVISIDAVESAQLPRPMMRMQADAAMAEAAPQSYNAGDIRFEATLTAVFALID